MYPTINLTVSEDWIPQFQHQATCRTYKAIGDEKDLALFWARGISRVTGEREGGMQSGTRSGGKCIFFMNVLASRYVSSFEFGADHREMLLATRK